jgi:hypothetical protein
MVRRLFSTLVVLALALSFTASEVDAQSQKQRLQQQQDSGGFFSRLFGPRPPRPVGNGGSNGNPFLFRPFDQGFGQPGASFFKRPNRFPKAPSEPPLVTVEVQPKDSKARKILVVGDFAAGGLAWGLDQALANEPKLAVLDKSNDGSGLVRPDFFDWNKTLPDLLNSEKPDLVVVLVGSNDRQQMKVGNARLAVGSETWEKTYTQRVDGMVDTLKVYGRPFFWVSAPPMRSNANGGDTAYLNGLYKPRVEAAGGSFIDIWNGFTNANGQYIATGPDIEGQVRQLRTGDGVNFTRAGRLKLSFYVEREVRRKTGVGAGTVDLLPSASQQSQIEIGPDGKKRLVGPVMSLSDPLPGASDTLAGGGETAEPAAETSGVRMIVKGEALPGVAGRVDDFAWPPVQAPAVPVAAPEAALPIPVAPQAAATAEPPVAPGGPAIAPANAPAEPALTPVSRSN